MKTKNVNQKINVLKTAKKLHLSKNNLRLYGNEMAKILNFKDRNTKQKLILVTAINPTKSGNGKTTVSIGLADAFSKLKQSVCLALREPSLGPVFGIKGGATGGGKSQIIPSNEINLNFTGDFHAITAANNLLCAMIDNHIFSGNELGIDVSSICFKRCLDCNDRALRDITINSTYQRKESFVITPASEIMAILCVATSLEDLKTRLGNILIAFTQDGKPLYCRDLKAEDAMTILLKDAINPNLVQTLEGTPAIVHMGPFANIAHGCNSITATKTAMKLADYTITEAGFGADLGAEKFFDFKCRVGDLNPNCVVLIATIPALKLHGGAEQTNRENMRALKKGLCNLYKHIDNIKNVYKLPLVVALNKFDTDTTKEIEFVKNSISSCNVSVVECYKRGSAGAINLAKQVIKECQNANKFSFAYDISVKIEQKIELLCKTIYGGEGVKFSKQAKQKLKLIKLLQLDKLPVIVAKTQYSLSDNAELIGAPSNFEIEVDDLEIKTGAGFIVAQCGKILLMPGLSKKPSAENMKIDSDGNISGIH